jgi:hypothetical protein
MEGELRTAQIPPASLFFLFEYPLAPVPLGLDLSNQDALGTLRLSLDQGTTKKEGILPQDLTQSKRMKS